MNLNNTVGGYFELELTNHGSVYHDNAYAVNSGRNALELILKNKKIKKLYLPYYTCDVTLQPLKRSGINYEFYKLDKLFNPIITSVNSEEWVLFVNYFGVFTNKVKLLLNRYDYLILDNSQAFFTPTFNDIPAFYSPRKFFGLPDGGFAFINQKIDFNYEPDTSHERFSHLLKRADNLVEQGYSDFQTNDLKLNDQPILKMSRLTKKLLSNIDFEKTKEIRNINFRFLHQYLKTDNELTDIIENAEINGPMVYPYLKKGNNKLRTKLINQQIYVAQYWPNVPDWVKDKDSWEYYLFNNLIPLPIDQRYSESDMLIILNLITGKSI